MSPVLQPSLAPAAAAAALSTLCLAQTQNRKQLQLAKSNSHSMHGDNNLRTRVNFILNALREMQLNWQYSSIGRGDGGTKWGQYLVGIAGCKWAQQSVVAVAVAAARFACEFVSKLADHAYPCPAQPFAPL